MSRSPMLAHTSRIIQNASSVKCLADRFDVRFGPVQTVAWRVHGAVGAVGAVSAAVCARHRDLHRISGQSPYTLERQSGKSLKGR